MAVKRKSPDATEDAPNSKQSKLNFGQKMNSGKTRQAGKAGPAKSNNKPSATSSRTAITSKPPPKAENGFTLTEVEGDIFDAPDNTLIIHACNTIGSWGAGIAAAFKQRYPNAFKTYQAHCKNSSPEKLIRTALVIPPQDGSPKHWVGCLFTSKVYGRKKDSPQEILDATEPAMEDLIKQMGDEIEEVRICQINSGLFAVPWDASKAVLEGIELDEDFKGPREIAVYSLPTK